VRDDRLSKLRRISRDVVGYSRMMGKDEAGGAALVREAARDVQPIIRRASGRPVKTMGDGMFSRFTSVVAAVDAPWRCRGKWRDQRRARSRRNRSLRIGVIGRCIGRKARISLASGVNSPPLGVSGSGGVCISGRGLRACAREGRGGFIDLGETALKNIRAGHVYARRSRTMVLREASNRVVPTSSTPRLFHRRASFAKSEATRNRTPSSWRDESDQPIYRDTGIIRLARTPRSPSRQGFESPRSGGVARASAAFEGGVQRSWAIACASRPAH